MYRTPTLPLAAVPLGLLYPRFYARAACGRRKDRLRRQFKEALLGLSSLLSAGRSVENALAALETDLRMLLGSGVRSDMLEEIRALNVRIGNGDTLEEALSDFAGRSDLQEARGLADAVSICKRSGGDLVEVMRRTAQLIGEKLDVELEISVLVASKKFESRIMMAMPFAFVGGLGWLAADYMQPLREGAGLLLLTVCLALFALICLWIVRLTDIRL